MRTELYSVRSSVEEMSFLNQNLRKIVKSLADKTSLRVLYKTEIDSNPRKIRADLIDSFTADNPPEFYIYVNALNSQDDSSFRYLFYPLIERLEKELPQEEVAQDGKTKLYPHIKVFPLTNLAGSYPAYCFVFRNKKILALPRISLVGGELTSYLCDAVNCAKEIFDKIFTECPEGFIFSTQKPQKSTGFGSIFAKKEVLSPAITQTTKAPAVKKAEKTIVIPEIFETEEASENTDDVTSDNADELFSALPLTEDLEAEIPAAELPCCNTPAENGSDSNSSASMILADDLIPKAYSDKAKKAKEAQSQQTEVPQTSETDNQPDEPTPQTDTKKKGFKAFLVSVFPQKGDSKKAVISKIAVLIAVVAFFTGAGLLLNFYVIKPWQNNSIMSEIQSIFYETSPDEVGIQTGISATPDEMPAKNWAGLEKINKEIVAWVKIDDTKIDYPVLFHEEDNADSQFYLYKNYKKKYSDFGSIFLDYRCPEGVNSKHVILHGHNMGSDDSMFGSLIQYSRNKGWVQGNSKYYKAHPIVKFDTPDTEAEWIIFATMKIEVSNENEAIFNYLLGDFTCDAQFMNFIYNIKERSYLSVDVPINENDRIITLSTCSYESSNMRTVVVARMVREGEDVSKYIKSVKQETPAKRVYSSFAQEYEAGNITWYDGEGKLEGDESLEYMEQAEMYVVRFVDANGKTIASQQVIKGKDATEPTGEAPRKASDGTYYYTFKKWDTSFKNVTKDLVIKPVFNKHPMEIPETTARETDPPETEAQTPVTPVTPVTPTPAPTPTQAPTKPPTAPPTAPPTQPVTEPPVVATDAAIEAAQ